MNMDVEMCWNFAISGELNEPYFVYIMLGFQYVSENLIFRMINSVHRV